jgi:hypothetical protein
VGAFIVTGASDDPGSEGVDEPVGAESLVVAWSLDAGACWVSLGAGGFTLLVGPSAVELLLPHPANAMVATAMSAKAECISGDFFKVCS